jgi:hypothetical protein
MNNGSGTRQTGGATQPTEGKKGAEDLREAAERAWRDRWGVPGGTPEQREGSPDRVGGDGAEPPEPEIQDDDVEREGSRKAADADDEDDV